MYNIIHLDVLSLSLSLSPCVMYLTFHWQKGLQQVLMSLCVRAATGPSSTVCCLPFCLLERTFVSWRLCYH